MKKKVLIWNMSYAVDASNPNFGDTVILQSIITLLKKIPFVETYFFVSNEKFKLNFDVVKKVRYSLKNIIDIIEKIRSCDGLIIGGGEFLTDRSTPLYSIYNLIPVFLANFFRKKKFGFGIGVDDVQSISPLAIILARLSFNENDIITVRDKESYENLFKLKIKSKIFVTSDLSFNLEIGEEEYSEKNFVVIAPRQPLPGPILNPFGFLPINIRLRKGYVSKAYQDELLAFKKNMAYTIDYLVSKYNMNCILLPFYRGSMSYYDDKLCNDICSLAANKEKIKIADIRLLHDFIEIFRKANFIIGVPFHSIALAIQTHTPVIAVAYHHKITRFMKEIQLEHFTVPCTEFSKKIGLKHVYNLIDEILLNKENIVKDIFKRNKILKTRGYGNIVFLKYFLNIIS